MTRNVLLHGWISWKSAHYDPEKTYQVNLHLYLAYFHFKIANNKPHLV